MEFVGFYNVVGKSVIGEKISYIVSFDPNHSIFAAHFPDNPITPGVCLLQVCKDLAEDVMEEHLALYMIKNVKFLKLLVPDKVTSVNFVFSFSSETKYKMAVEICDNNGDVYAKFNLIFSSCR